MVALNFQTRDKELQINRGKRGELPNRLDTKPLEELIFLGWFLQNGGCGYVLKPDFMTGGELLLSYKNISGPPTFE